MGISDGGRRIWPRLWGSAARGVIAIENDKYNPTLELAMRMARLLNRPVEEIFFLEEGANL